MNYPNTGSSARVGSSGASIALAADNYNRQGLVVHNSSTATLYLKYGTAASIGAGTESYTYKVPPDGTFEMDMASVYTGVVHGIWDAVNGFAMVTEVLP